MQVIAFAQQKGGVGKTTLAVNVAGELFGRGFRVVLVDSDPQASAVAWSTLGALGFEVRPELLGGFRSSSWIRNVLKLPADLIVLDTPAELGDVLKVTVEIADLLVVPVGPSSLDINSARQTLAALDRLAARAGAAPQVALIPTRVDPRTAEGQQLAPELSELGRPLLPAISYDMAYVRAFAAGRTLSTYFPGAPADVEIRNATDSILRLLGFSATPSPVPASFRRRDLS